MRALPLLLAVAACAGGDGAKPLFGNEPADELDLRAAASATEVPLLGELELTVDLFVGAERDVEFRPVVPSGFRGEFVERPGRPIAGGSWTRFVAALRPVELGELEIPPFEVRDREVAATTGAITITVRSVLEGHDAEVEAPAEPFAPPPPAWPWLAGAGALVLLGAWLLWRRWRRAHPRPEPDATPLPPHVTALRALARLRDARRITPAEIEAFYVAVSQVLRVYLEERFGLRAPERTTEEFLPEVEQSNLLDAEQRVHLRQFLEQCDLVKFAAAVPSEDVHSATFAFAEGLVESTRPDREPEAVPA